MQITLKPLVPFNGKVNTMSVTDPITKEISYRPMTDQEITARALELGIVFIDEEAR